MTEPDDEAPAPPKGPPVDFPRGGAGPPQPLPRGASLVLLLASIGVVGGMMALLAWLLL